MNPKPDYEIICEQQVRSTLSTIEIDFSLAQNGAPDVFLLQQNLPKMNHLRNHLFNEFLSMFKLYNWETADFTVQRTHSQR